MRPSWSTTTASGMRSTSSCSSRRDSSSSRRARRSSVASRNTSTTPWVSPRSSTMGAALSSMATSAPLRCRSAVCAARVTTARSRSARAAGSGAGSREASCRIGKTSASGRPTASARDQPVRLSATWLRKVTRSSRSVVTTPSPIDWSVVAKSRSRSAIARWVACLWSDTSMVERSSRSSKGLMR
jgi:hypothetical protein